jgi:hypothetical protein
MKFAKTLSLIGVASAVDMPIGWGQCTNFNVEKGSYWDFRQLDADNRIEGTETAMIKLDSSNSFYYELCSKPWAMSDETWTASGKTGKPSNTWTQNEDITKLSSAYLSNGNAQKYSFASGTVASDGDDSVITWSSREKCDGENKFTFSLKAICDANLTETTIGAVVKTDKCNYSTDYSSSTYCPTDLPITEALNKLAPFIGIILVAFGFALCFFGTKWYEQLVGVVIGLIAAAVFFGLGLVFAGATAGIGPVIGCGVVAILLGAAVGYCMTKILHKFLVPSLCGVTFGVGVLMLGTIASQKGTVLYVLCFIGFVGGFVLGMKEEVQETIKCISTAIIGSFIFVRGVGSFAPGFPSLTGFNAKDTAKALIDNPNANIAFIAYFAGFIVLAIAGFIYQRKTQLGEKGESMIEEGGEDDKYERI